MDKRIRPHLKLTNDSWRVDETYIKIKGLWKYLYRAADSQGNTLDLLHECKARWQGSDTFFRKVLNAQHTQAPRVITVDKNAAYPVAMAALQEDETILEDTELRQSKYLNNVI